MSDEAHRFYGSNINNSAALHLQDGKYKLAISELTEALVLLSKRLRKEEVQNDSSFEGVILSPKPILGFAMGRDEQEGLLAKPDNAAVLVSKCFTPSIKDETQANASPVENFVFRSPMYIQNAGELLPTTCTIEVISYAVIYNIALAWHLSALMPGNDAASRTAKLKKALSLYEQTNKLLENGNITTYPLPYMAVLCNTGVIYKFFNEAVKATTCQDLLLSTMMFCIERGCQSPGWDSIVEGFLANLRLLTDVAPAA